LNGTRPHPPISPRTFFWVSTPAPHLSNIYTYVHVFRHLSVLRFHKPLACTYIYTHMSVCISTHSNGNAHIASCLVILVLKLLLTLTYANKRDCILICTHVSTYLYACIHICIGTHRALLVSCYHKFFASIYIHTCSCVYIDTCVHVYIHVCTYIDTFSRVCMY